MTGRAAGRNPGVIHRRPRPKGCRRLVAGFAAERSGNMRRRFAQRRRAVMTAHATGHDPGVIKRRPRKRRRGLVTILARSGGRHVVRWLAYDPGVPAAMTQHAVGRNPGAIDRRSRPKGRRRLMAGFAAEGGWNVGCRFAQRRRAVMTGHATSHDPCMVICGNPRKRYCGLVTILTWSGRRDVVGRFAHDPRIPARRYDSLRSPS